MQAISRAVSSIRSAGLLLGLAFALGTVSAHEPAAAGSEATPPPATAGVPAAQPPSAAHDHAGHDHSAHSHRISGADVKDAPKVIQPAPAVAEDPEESGRRYFSDLEVVDQDGKRLRFFSDVLKGRVVVINFVFTNCQDACPMMTRKLIQTRAMMPETMRDQVWFVSISVDPERDTPAALKEFAARNGVKEGEPWLFLTGTAANMKYIVSRFGQYTAEVEDHSTLMIAGNVRTRHWLKVLPMVPPPGIAQQLRDLVEEG